MIFDVTFGWDWGTKSALAVELPRRMMSQSQNLDSRCVVVILAPKSETEPNIQPKYVV